MTLKKTVDMTDKIAGIIRIVIANVKEVNNG
jgi:hypothetical protein